MESLRGVKKMDAQTNVTSTGQKIRTQKEQAEEEARQMSENSLKEAEASAQKEADALRQLVEPKREEAVEAVITSLV